MDFETAQALSAVSPQVADAIFGSVDKALKQLNKELDEPTAQELTDESIRLDVERERAEE